ncbi:MAG TPA: head GIN domain-containing protein [Usitatibacter sp.]|nr:head GIN domain-containing protein [Usitatibacter sp.]
MNIPRIAAAAILLAGAASAADVREETRNVSGFDTVSLAVPIDLEIAQGDAEGLTLQGDAATLAKIEAVVEDGTLRIRTPSHVSASSFGKVTGRVSLKSVKGLTITGAGKMHSAALRSKKLHLAITGAGDIDVGRLDADDVDLSVTGSGNVRLAGKVDRASTSILGAGDLKAPRLEAREAHVSISGAGDVTLWARERIEVSIAGAGDVRYYGDPAVNRSVWGAGSVKRLGAAPG